MTGESKSQSSDGKECERQADDEEKQETARQMMGKSERQGKSERDSQANDGEERVMEKSERQASDGEEQETGI